MKFNLEHSPGNRIHSYRTGEIKVILDNVAEPQIIKTSLILTPTHSIQDWIRPDEALTESHLQQLLAINPEIIVLGTGPKIAFPEPALLAICHQASVGFEVMDTGAACRTYNVLSAEGRKVCAAFMRV